MAETDKPEVDGPKLMARSEWHRVVQAITCSEISLASCIRPPAEMDEPWPVRQAKKSEDLLDTFGVE